MSEAALRPTLLAGVLADAYRETVPIFVLAELTNACNAACRHCYVDASRREIMARREWARLWDQLAPLGTLVLTLSGGEPLLHPEFAGIYADAWDRGFAVRLFTNALLLDESVLPILRARPPWLVETSLYGPDAAVHDRITGRPGSFARTTAAVRSLVGLGFRVVVKTTWTKANAGRAQEIAAVAKSLGAAFRGAASLAPARDGRPYAADQRLDLTSLRAIMKFGKGDSKAGFGHLEDVVPRSPEREDGLCGAGRITMRIAAGGKVHPCVLFEEEAGDARRSELAEIWRLSPVFAGLRCFRGWDRPACARCELRADCSPCPALALRKGGSLGACDPEARRLARVHKQIREEEDERSLRKA